MFISLCVVSEGGKICMCCFDNKMLKPLPLVGTELLQNTPLVGTVVLKSMMPLVRTAFLKKHVLSGDSISQKACP